VSLELGALIAALAAEFQVQLRGDARRRIVRLAPLETAGPEDLSFLSHPKYVSQLAHTRAGCIIVSPALEEAARVRGDCLVVADPYRFFARCTQVWKERHRRPLSTGIHPTAWVDPSAQVHPQATVGAFACVGPDAIVGEGAWLDAHVVVGAGAQVGTQTRLAAQVSLGEDCRIGARGIVHAGVVIGADGFGFAPAAGRWEKIEQLGAVRIGDDVEIGANTCIDRGALDDTVIEDGVKLDNLIQIGHNVHVGAHTAMAGCVGVAGSARIGAHCTLGGGAIVLGHLSIADQVHISAASVVTRSISRPGQYSGFFPIDDNGAWEKNAATLKQLHALRERLKQLEAQLRPRAA